MEQVQQNDDEISLIDLLVVLLKHWKMIVIIPIVSILIAIGYIAIRPVQQQTNETYATITVNPLIEQFAGSVNLEVLISNFYLKDLDVLYKAVHDVGLTKINSYTIPTNSDEAMYLVKCLLIDGKTPKNTELKDSDKPYVIINNNGVITITIRFKDKEQSRQFVNIIMPSVNAKVSDLLLPIARKEVQDYEKLLEEGSKSASNLLQNSLAVRYPSYSSAQRFVKGEQIPLMISGPTTVEIPETNVSKSFVIIIVVFTSLFLAVFLAFVLEAIENVKNDPESMAKIRSALQGKKNKAS